MIVKRIYDDTLAQASYLIGCAATGEALVVDPNRDVEQYLRIAAAEGVRVTHVTETHIHADFVSGARELAERAGATLLLSDEGGADWRYAFAEASGATLLHHGDSFVVGNVRLDVLHTPGHTPEHLTFLVTDTAATSAPIAAITGDFVFVAEVGRPDLLEKSANVAGSMDASARTLFASLQAFKQLPDYVQIWPGHGAGSACGKSLGAIPSSTIGYERFTNWAFVEPDVSSFVQRVLADQPDPPKYFGEMKRVNKLGPQRTSDIPPPALCAASHLTDILRSGKRVVDTRSAAEFARGHVPGTLNIPLSKRFNTWAGSLLPYDDDLYLLVGDPTAQTLERAVHDLALVGLDRVSGYFTADALDDWRAAGHELAVVPQMDVGGAGAAVKDGTLVVVDVREPAEWRSGHIEGSLNIPLGRLADRVSTLPSAPMLLVHCKSGARSAIAASMIQAKGRSNVVNLVGGFAAWRREQLPTLGPE